jgi:phenylacetate-CoA ligase
VYSYFCSRVLFPLHERLKGHHSAALHRQLERTQWLDQRSLQSLQLQNLRCFLEEAVRCVPFYRAAFQRDGLTPESVASLADLQRLPLLTKTLVRANTETLKSTRATKLRRYNTGGSSGEPLVFYMGLGRISHDVAAKWRATRWWGVDIGDPEIVLWGSPIELGAQDRLKALRDIALRTRLLPAFEMSDGRLDEHIDVIRRVKPRMIYGYASAVALLARRARARAVPMDRLGTRVVFVTGETLYPDQRQVIEEIFGAPVANGYGSRDAGFIAHQCPAGSLHISAEHILVELLDAAGHPVPPGQYGEIVVTHLATGDFPFVRYRTGDVGVLGEQPCTCGRGLPVLKEVVGRTTDFVRTPSGNVMHALALIYEVRDKPGVQAFKFVQSEDLSLELALVTGAEFTAAVESEIRTGVLRRMGEGAQLRIRRVDAIPAENSGKYRYVVSRASVNP